MKKRFDMRTVTATVNNNEINGYFHRWADQPLMHPDGADLISENCTMALIEDLDGHVHLIHPSCMKFTDTKSKICAPNFGSIRNIDWYASPLGGIVEGSKILVKMKIDDMESFYQHELSFVSIELDSRGYPIPYVVLRDDHGCPHFKVNDSNKSDDDWKLFRNVGVFLHYECMYKYCIIVGTKFDKYMEQDHYLQGLKNALDKEDLTLIILVDSKLQMNSPIFDPILARMIVMDMSTPSTQATPPQPPTPPRDRQINEG